ncbi:MAG: hypothetical protein IKO22_01605, partial [Oscillospiraceae bacterium]|nr:hypothetical protein [Oscillospiraceae bacterium]
SVRTLSGAYLHKLSYFVQFTRYTSFFALPPAFLELLSPLVAGSLVNIAPRLGFVKLFSKKF